MDDPPDPAEAVDDDPDAPEPDEPEPDEPDDDDVADEEEDDDEDDAVLDSLGAGRSEALLEPRESVR